MQFGGDERNRTAGLLRAKQALSQLSYIPTGNHYIQMVGIGGLEPPTSRLSGVRSNRLSYTPTKGSYEYYKVFQGTVPWKLNSQSMVDWDRPGSLALRFKRYFKAELTP